MRGAPKERIGISKSHGKLQFFIRNYGKKIYLPENHELVIPLLQKYYEEKCLEITEKRIEAVDAFLKIDSSTSCEEIYNNMDPKLRQFINPLGLTLDEKMERWNNMKYEPYLAHPEELVFNTDGGDKVRSKSEKIIADILYKHGVLYHYEMPLFIGNKMIVPDFTIYDAKNNRIIYWEHLGMMDNSQYFMRAMDKYKMYVLAEKDVFLTMESGNKPLDIDMVEKKAAEFSILNN